MPIESRQMTVTTIALPVPFAVRAVNCYLLEGDPLTLIDPGADWPETLVELEASLSARGLRLEDVEQIILTHQHYDHVGLAHTVRERSGATVVAHHLCPGSSPISRARWSSRTPTRPT